MGSNRELVFGIDLGTTNSCIARYTDDGAKIFDIEGFPTTPSVVAVSAEGEWIVGRRAKNYGKVHPGSAVASIKRRMGDKDFRVMLGAFECTPITVSSKILAFLKKEAERALEAEGFPSATVENVVITVPAWFGEEQRQATVAAGKLAGLNVLRIVNEPTAAALAFSSPSDAEVRSENWVVYDLGGGTFDVSVLSVLGETKEVLASCGNTFLGGDDFDQQIVNKFVGYLKSTYSVDPQSDPLVVPRLLTIAEETKIRLSTEVTVSVREIVLVAGKPLELSFDISREELESMIEPFIDSTIAKVRQALEEAHVSASDVSRLLLVGGTTRIPMISQRLEKFFGRAPEDYVDPDLSVALGAAIQAGIAVGREFRQIVVDVAPHSLGIAVVSTPDTLDLNSMFRGLMSRFDDDSGDNDEIGIPSERDQVFDPLVRRNTKLPVQFAKRFSKVVPGQERVLVEVYQGESRNLDDNTFVGRFFAPFGIDDEMDIIISLEYDLNGTVKVGVREDSPKAKTKYFAMGLGRDPEINSEIDVEAKNSDETLASPVLAQEVMNFLIQRIEQKIERAAEGSAMIQPILDRYRLALQAGDDDSVDQLEDQLNDWLETEPSEKSVNE